MNLIITVTMNFFLNGLKGMVYCFLGIELHIRKIYGSTLQ